MISKRITFVMNKMTSYRQNPNLSICYAQKKERSTGRRMAKKVKSKEACYFEKVCRYHLSASVYDAPELTSFVQNNLSRKKWEIQIQSEIRILHRATKALRSQVISPDRTRTIFLQLLFATGYSLLHSLSR